MDLQKIFTRIVYKLESLFDAVKYKFRPKIREANSLLIIPYLGFGSKKFLELKGRVLQDSGVRPSRKTDRIWDNLINMYRRFESDEVPNARLLASFEGQELEILADEEGYFEISIEIDNLEQPELGWQKVNLELLEPQLVGDGSVNVEGKVMIVSPEAEFGVISDIDDTAVYTGVTSRLKLARTVLLKNAYTRLPLDGVAKFYNALQRGQDSSGNNPLFYVSSSPWNMYDVFQEFFKINNIPMGPIFLRDWGFERNSMVAEKNRTYKLNTIFKILTRYPQLQFILIGDSGEEDPEIYEQVIESFPGRILCAYIRDVEHDVTREAQIRRLAKDVLSSGSMLILADDAHQMAGHAAQHGWITLSPVSQPAE
ncbi:MAG: App1 family protein [Anaerolineales bacterium]|jgi:phosphatidate phosphatase APP1